MRIKELWKLRWTFSCLLKEILISGNLVLNQIFHKDMERVAENLEIQ